MTHLKEGDKAPDFTAVDQDGKEISLKDYKGKKVILYFYPNDDTPTCTTEACNFRDNYRQLQKEGYEVVGVSVNEQKSHRKFIDKYELPFDLISDPNKEVIDAYGVWGLKKFMGREFMGTHRLTFVIDEIGIIESIITKVKSKIATQQVFDLVKS